MKTETKTIIIGIAITLLVLIISLFVLYKIDQKKTMRGPETNTNLNEYGNKNQPQENIEDEMKEEEKTDPVNQEQKPANNNESTIKEDIVTIYLFRGEGCPHCEDAITFFQSIIKNYPYLEVKSIEVWQNKENYKFLESIASDINLEKIGSVPVIVIGNSYTKIGFSKNMSDDILDTIIKESKNKNYQDIIKDKLNNKVTIEEIKND